MLFFFYRYLKSFVLFIKLDTLNSSQHNRWSNVGISNNGKCSIGYNLKGALSLKASKFKVAWI